MYLVEKNSDSLQSQYALLAELKQIDDKAYRIRIDIDRIPLQIETLGKSLDERRKKLETARAALDNCEKKLRAAEAELRDREDKLVKAESKMMEVKTNEEYKAAMKENQMSRDSKGTLEERVLALLNEAEQQRTIFKALEAEFRTEEAKIQAEQKILQDENDKLAESLAQAKQRRATKAAELVPDVKDLYDRVCAISATHTIVFGDAGMCRGCNMKIRPQLYNEILGYRAVHRCASCGKILILTTSSPTTPTDGHGE